MFTVVFGIEIGLNGSNHSSTDFHHPMKKFLPSPKFHTLSLPPTWTGDFSPTASMLFGKPWHVSSFHYDVYK